MPFLLPNQQRQSTEGTSTEGTREIGVRTEKKNANGTKQSRCTDPRVLRPQSHDPRSAARLDELRQSLREFAALVVGEAGSRLAVDDLLNAPQRRVHVVVAALLVVGVVVVED